MFISVFDRPHHFKHCIESLKKNHGADKTELYISSDGPDSDDSFDKVNQVRTYARSIHGFKKVNLFFPKENTGRKIIGDTKKNIYSFHNAYLASEDDNIFAPSFLDFINHGLELYKDNEEVFSICGYNYPNFPSGVNIKPVALRAYAAWGYGTWSNRDYVNPQFDQSNLMKEIIENKSLFAELNHGLPHMVPMIKSILDGTLRAGDVTRSALLFKEKKICIFPSISLVRNIGHDGTGLHCGLSMRYENQEICTESVSFERLTDFKPKKSHTLWLNRFYGGRISELRNWLIYLELTSNSRTTKFFSRFIVILYQLPRKLALNFYRGLIRIFA